MGELSSLTDKELKARMKDLESQARPFVLIVRFLTTGQEKILSRIGAQMDAVQTEMDRRRSQEKGDEHEYSRV